jgi:hypothetical protein
MAVDSSWPCDTARCVTPYDPRLHREVEHFGDSERLKAARRMTGLREATTSAWP